MLGPNGTSLLHKLGKQLAHEIPEIDYIALIVKEQERRTFQRAIGRIVRSNKGKSNTTKITHLEQLGLSPIIIAKLRATTRSEAELLKQIQKAGLL